MLWNLEWKSLFSRNHKLDFSCVWEWRRAVVTPGKVKSWSEFYWSSVEIVIKCSLRICRPDVPAVRPAFWKFLLAQAKRAGLRPWPVTELTNCSLVIWDRLPCIFQHIVGLNCNGHHMIERAKMSWKLMSVSLFREVTTLAAALCM